MYPGQYSSDLSTAFSASEADLEANRKGYLTTSQMENLPFFEKETASDEASYEPAAGAALSVISGAVVAFAFFAFLLGNGYELTQLVPVSVRPIAVGLIFISVAVSLIWLAYAAVEQNKTSRSWNTARIPNFPVEYVTGTVQPFMDHSHDGEERAFVQMGGRRIQTQPSVLRSFGPGRRYRLYFVDGPSGPWLVSAEEIGAEPNA